MQDTRPLASAIDDLTFEIAPTLVSLDHTLLLEVEPSQRPALPELMAGLPRALAAPAAERAAA